MSARRRYLFERNTYSLDNSSNGFPVSSSEEIRLLVNTSGETSLNMWCVARSRRTRPAIRLSQALRITRDHSTDSGCIHAIPLSDVVYSRSLKFTTCFKQRFKKQRKNQITCGPASRNISAMWPSFATAREAGTVCY